MGNSEENNTENKNNGSGQEGFDFNKILSFCKKNIKYISAGVIVVALVIVLVIYFKPDSKTGSPDNAIASTEEEKAEPYAVDAYPAINELISKYYTAYAGGDVATLATLATPITATEQSYIQTFSQFVEQYENISCYTKKGLDSSSYIVSVYLEIKFSGVDTAAPGLDFFYVRTNNDGSVYIDNLYSQFNMQNQEQALDTSVASLISDFEKQQDVIDLQNDVQKKYDAAISSDEKLKVMVETTVPDAISAWAANYGAEQATAEQAAADQAAKEKEEADKAAADQAAAEQAAADQAAKEKEEADKAAADQAAKETLYATEKINVRSDANETADKLGQLEGGAQVTRLEARDDGWSRIEYNGGEGYVKSEYLSDQAPAQAPAEETKPAGALAEGKEIILQETVNIRESMDESSAKIGVAYAGEKVRVVMSYQEGWTKVNWNDKIGYIKTDLLQ